ncbi:MAG: FtsK/SpoIIIE domain-containing protein, partial [Acidimicrobiaceae bacterium]|nr:FtsK/SpoIIIE domain-containing protein [Acidimicrobiaceae bacterium]
MHAPSDPNAAFELAVVGGPAAGGAVALAPGAVVTIGREPDNALVVDDHLASRHHARIRVTAAGGVVEDIGSRNGVGWAGQRITAPQALTPGDVVQIGDSVVALRVGERVAQVLDPPAHDGTRRFNRPPRLAARAAAAEIRLPREPVQPTGRRFPLLSLLAPIGMGALMVVLTHTIAFAAFVILSPIMMVGNFVSDRRNGRRTYRVELAGFRAAQAELDGNIAGIVAADELARRAELPDPAALVRIATGPTARLWERRVDDPDFLRLRAGLTDAPANVHFRDIGDTDIETPLAHLVPTAYGLDEAGVAGIAGPRPAALAWARAAICQVAALHGPGDVHVVILTGQDGTDDWEWALWLPHLVPPDPSWGCARLVGAGRHQVEARLATLRRLIDERRDQARTQLQTGPVRGARVVVVIDGARQLRALDGVAEILRQGPEVGVLALCLDEHANNLPEECNVTVVAEAGSASRVAVRRKGSEPVRGVIADGIDPTSAARLARALAPVVDLAPRRGASGELPRTVGLLDLLGLDEPSPADVLRAWTASPGGRSTEAVIGASATGPFAIDLRRDGPHGLLAGTTGAGKSELLQSLVASLALANRPDALSFVLVDYKGGSAFKDCRNLPHCVGLITDLDGHLAARALASLTAELKRRETLLAEAGAKDIEEYWARTDGTRAPALPRLAIVVDEFATLVEEVPEFVRGVVGIGMRGRSLGVHVILATQRPGGVVTGDLRANLNLRICLRVANPTESGDVIEVPDAARLSRDTPGRAYALTGYRDLTLFQTARVGGARTSGEVAPDARAGVEVEPLTFAAAGATPPDAASSDSAEASGPSDLSLLVEAIATAARDEGVATPPSPWLAPLPDVVPVGTLRPADCPLCATVGVIDLPEAQKQQPFTLDLGQAGSLAVIGAIRSGRSTALRTIAAGLVAANGPEDLHLYALDCGNRALEPLAALPHVGAVVNGDDAERTGRLIDLLAGMVSSRTRAGVTGPPVVVLIDRFDAFVGRYSERDAGRLVDVMDRLLREGAAVGLHFVISGDRTAFTSRLASAIETRLVLRQTDRNDVALMGLNPRDVPTEMPNGRAIWAQTGHEVQIAALGPDAGEAGQLEALRLLAAAAMERWPAPRVGRRARRVEPLPDRIGLAAVTAAAGSGREAAPVTGADRAPNSAAPTSPGREACPPPSTDRALNSATGCEDALVTLGVGGDELEAAVVDLLDAGPGFVIAGPARSGRSSALATAVRSLSGRHDGRRPVIIVAPRPSPLRDLAGLPGVAAVLTDVATLGTDLPAAL